jgi:hypothetical protein
MSNTRLTVAFPRKSSGKTIHRALSSLEGAAKEALPMFGNADTSSSEFSTESETLKISFPYCGINIETMNDVPETYGGFLPEKNAKGAVLCAGKNIPSSLSTVANELLRAASGDYVLFMNPGEVCLDPVNIIRTMDFLDTQPQIDVVSCPVKVYSDGEHARTVMAPKIFRNRREGRGEGGESGALTSHLPPIAFSGVLADNWEPCNDINWLLSASGFTFMDHGDAWPWSHASDLFDLKLLLASYVHQAWPADDVGRAKAIVAGTKIGQLLTRWNAGGAYVILSGIIDNAPSKTPDIVPALVARGRSCWRGEDPDYYEAMEDLDLAIQIWPTAAAYLERGFLRHGLDWGWFEDLQRGIEICRQTTSYGLDMRELALAEKVVRARPVEDPKRCREHARLNGDGRCLLDADGHSKHEAMDCGERVTWCDP